MSTPVHLHSLGRAVGTKPTSEEIRRFREAYGDSLKRPTELLYRPHSDFIRPAVDMPAWARDAVYRIEHPQHLNHIHFDIPRRHRRARPLDWAVAAVILAIRFLTRRSA